MVKVATFNVENLFARFKFEKGYSGAQIDGFIRDGWKVDATMVKTFSETEKEITAAAIKEADADILCLQEVECLDSLKRFLSDLLPRAGYRHRMLVDGNDPRLIDVAVVSRFPIVSARSNQHLADNGKGKVFSRDCLEVVVRLGDEDDLAAPLLPIFVNHFKSMLGGRDKTMARRRRQAEEVRRILTARFGADPGAHDWIVVGDLNDYLPSDGLEPLFRDQWCENVIERLPPEERWTHFWDGAPKGDEPYRQIDYMLVSRALAQRNAGMLPRVVRSGLCTKASRYDGPRLAGVTGTLAASDHCPVVIDLTV